MDKPAIVRNLTEIPPVAGLGEGTPVNAHHLGQLLAQIHEGVREFTDTDASHFGHLTITGMTPNRTSQRAETKDAQMTSQRAESRQTHTTTPPEQSTLQQQTERFLGGLIGAERNDIDRALRDLNAQERETAMQMIVLTAAGTAPNLDGLRNLMREHPERVSPSVVAAANQALVSLSEWRDGPGYMLTTRDTGAQANRVVIHRSPRWAGLDHERAFSPWREISVNGIENVEPPPFR